MSTYYKKSWRRSVFKERDDKICRLWSDGMKLNILCKRFGISAIQIKRILKERKDG